LVYNIEGVMMYGWASILRSLHSHQRTDLENRAKRPFKLPISAIRKGRVVEAFWGEGRRGGLVLGNLEKGVEGAEVV